MKITAAKNQDTKFKPVSFSITCEARYELDAWRALFNHTPFNNYLGLPGALDVVAVLDGLGADKKQSDVIWQKHLCGVTFDGVST